MKQWPKDNTKYLQCSELLEPLRKAVRAGCTLRRKNKDKDIPYDGYDIGWRDRATCHSPDEALTARAQRYNEEQGRDFIDTFLLIAFQLGVEQGRRVNTKEVMGHINSCKKLRQAGAGLEYVESTLDDIEWLIMDKVLDEKKDKWMPKCNLKGCNKNPYSAIKVVVCLPDGSEKTTMAAFCKEHYEALTSGGKQSISMGCVAYDPKPESLAPYWYKDMRKQLSDKEKKMKIKFWGVRGSIPTPGKETVKYGGNTSCVSVEVDDQLIILDGGSGLRVLGMDLMGRIFAEGKFKPIEAHLFFSHVHWDHIQGVPFFEPMFVKGNKVHMYGEKKARTSLEETLKGQQQYPNFPISIEEISILGADMSFTDLCAGQAIRIPNVGQCQVVVDTVKLSHPDGVLAYKVTAEIATTQTKSFVYATDTEHRDVLDQRIVNFCKKGQQADVLVYDAQYSPEEYSGQIGIPKFDWGHSTYEWGVDTAIAAGVKTLVLFHHEPKHNDAQIDDIVAKAKERAAGKIKVVAAIEGMELEI